MRIRRFIQFLHRLHARRAALAGFAFGIALPLVLAGLVMAPFGGGLSDRPAPAPLAIAIDMD